ncbi:DUF2007 domain-containing protein [Patescibacteria group bacterium]|nr:DUF2007 domain-containing protein [Patescibacteria group bacterium]MCL5798428.1 DUF2007 domain-containing protein [Patescibacteria group bacterium]
MTENIVVLKTYSSRIEAELVRGKLETVGIESFVMADDAGGMYPFPAQSGFDKVKLFVRKSDLKNALKLLCPN